MDGDRGEGGGCTNNSSEAGWGGEHLLAMMGRLPDGVWTSICLSARDFLQRLQLNLVKAYDSFPMMDSPSSCGRHRFMPASHGVAEGLGLAMKA